MKTYEKYPLWIITIINILQLTVYSAGAYIIFRLNIITGILYIIYLILIETGVYREGCRHCYYYGKRCAFGRGAIAPFFVKKGNAKNFEREIKWKDFMPQILVILIPIIIGIALFISRGFHLLTLIAVIYPILSWFCLNPIIYGRLACPNCKQGKRCCPALKFFKKK